MPAAPQAPPRYEPSPIDQHVIVMKALADPTRLEMVRLIGSQAEYPCTSLEDLLAVSKSTISYHVKHLRQAGLVTVRREGKFFFYSLRRDVLEYYCPGLLARLPTGDA